MKVITAAGISIAVILLLSSVKYVGPGSVGVQTFLGRVQPGVLSPGVSLSIPFSSVQSFDTRQVVIPETFAALTQDAQAIKVTGTITYRINPQNASQIFQSVGTSDEDVRNKIVQPAILGALKRIVSDHTMGEIIAKQGLIADQVDGLIRSELSKNQA
jgi:regulator of protease activity HflC (stomatin/prohibitin superfamily)